MQFYLTDRVFYKFNYNEKGDKILRKKQIRLKIHLYP